MTRKDVVKLIKRFLITFLCTLPLLVLIGYLLIGKISNALMTFIFVVIAGGVFFLEEVIRYQKKQNKKDE
jgi:zinc transporter ZupT